MDDVKLLSTKLFGECNFIGNVKYDQNEILENWIYRPDFWYEIDRYTTMEVRYLYISQIIIFEKQGPIKR